MLRCAAPLMNARVLHPVIFEQFVGCAVRTITNRGTGGAHGAPYVPTGSYFCTASPVVILNVQGFWRDVLLRVRLTVRYGHDKAWPLYIKEAVSIVDTNRSH